MQLLRDAQLVVPLFFPQSIQHILCLQVGIVPDKCSTLEHFDVNCLSNTSRRTFSFCHVRLWNPNKKKMTIDKQCPCLISLEGRQAGRHAHTHTLARMRTCACVHTHRCLTEHLLFSPRPRCGHKSTEDTAIIKCWQSDLDLVDILSGQNVCIFHTWNINHKTYK